MSCFIQRLWRKRNRNNIGRIYCSHKSRSRSKQSRSGCSSVLSKVLTRVTAVSPEKEFLSVHEIETVTSKHKKNKICSCLLKGFLRKCVNIRNFVLSESVQDCGNLEIFKFAFPGKFLQTNRNVRDLPLLWLIFGYTQQLIFCQSCKFYKFYKYFFLAILQTYF